MSGDFDLDGNRLRNAVFEGAVIGMEWESAWATATAYTLNDVVSNGGSSYICIIAHTSGTFSTDLAALKWDLVAQKGDTGAAGADATGDVVGPAASTDSSLARFDGTTGVLLKDGAVIGVDVQAYDADTLKADVDDTLTGGFGGTDAADGTKSSGTYTPTYAGGNFKTATNGGAHTLAPQSGTGTIIIDYTNNASAGAITTSGWTKVDGAFTTTNGDKFTCFLKVGAVGSYLNIVAMQ